MNIEAFWDSRVRQYLTSRYDYKQGAFDWDLSMHLHDKCGCKQVTKIEYNRWRETGIAFCNHMDSDYKFINRTLISGKIFKAREKIDKTFRSGYWGDIITGPFITFGVETENKEMLKMGNHLPTHSSEMISEFNIMAMFYEMTNPGMKYSNKTLDNILEIVEESSSNLQNFDIKINFYTNEGFVKFKNLNFDKIAQQKSSTTTFCSTVFDKTLLSDLDVLSGKLILERPQFLLDVVNEEFLKNWDNYFDQNLNKKKCQKFDKTDRLILFS